MAETNTPQQDVLTDIESRTPQTMHPILEAAFKYRNQIIIAVCAIIGVAALYAGVTAYTTKAKADAQAELGAILVETTGADQIAKLEALAANVPGSVKPAVVTAIAQATMTAGEYAKAATYWGMLAAEAEGDTRFAAKLGKAKSLLLAGKAQEALAELKPMAADAPEGYIIPVNRQLALAAEAAGDKSEALAAYKKLAENNVNDKPFVDYKITQLEAQ